MSGVRIVTATPVPVFSGMAECYAALPQQLTDEMVMLAERVEEHLKPMEVSWE